MLHDENDQVRALALEAAADVMKEIKIGVTFFFYEGL